MSDPDRGPVTLQHLVPADADTSEQTEPVDQSTPQLDTAICETPRRASPVPAPSRRSASSPPPPGGTAKTPMDGAAAKPSPDRVVTNQPRPGLPRPPGAGTPPGT
ncbi:neural Wiskott-Aldrich syndrome protein-like [Gigantopelta aegis]|uniref:neural Wiskott-Aldrich syndrome protein-like n=1 Tax=Gigantopelta aegis TaxID=1735272 RepID=UPI001B88CB4B|nr:neural Wiskott-Aldrich syndrome protein-like [Gigantopelta aegis]